MPADNYTVPPDVDPPPLLEPPPPRRRRLILVIVLLVLAAIAAAAWFGWGRTSGTDSSATAAKGAGGPGAPGGGGGRRGGADGNPRAPMPVTVAPARTMDFIVYQNALGNVLARNTVTVHPRVDGQLARVLFREGQMVKAGDLLAEIDPRPFEVQVTQANGQLARDQAQLANARIDLQRYQTLQKQDSIAQQQVDTQAALVRQYEGTIEADRGVVDNAKLQLSYTRIIAPSSGRLGLRQVDAGNMVHQSDANGIVVITQVQPINVVYSIPEDRLSAVARRVSAGEVLRVDAYDRDGRVKLASGKLLTIDNQIDPTTGTIKLKAEFGNDDGALFPNQFVNVRMQVDVLKGATVIASSAVQRGSSGTFVYRVNEDSTVSVRPIKIGPVEGETTVVASGLAPGEHVVTDGADKLRDGAKIEAITPQAPGAAPAGGQPGARSGAAQGAADGQGRRSGGGVVGGRGSRTGGQPTVPGGGAPAGNAPLSNAPGAGAPAAPSGVAPSPSR